jgi:hypothetical protein
MSRSNVPNPGRSTKNVPVNAASSASYVRRRSESRGTAHHPTPHHDHADNSRRTPTRFADTDVDACIPAERPAANASPSPGRLL